MKSLELQVDDLHQAYRQWAGEPVFVSTFRRENRLPVSFEALDVLCYRSGDEDRLRAEDEFTFLVTAGLSLQETDDPIGRVELVWRLQGRRTWQEIQALAEALAAIAVLPQYGPVRFAPGAVIRNISLPIFDRMDSLLITHWGVHSPEYLPGLQPPVLLLSIKALFGSEAAIVEQIGPEEACRRFLLEELDWDAPDRKCAGLDCEGTEAKSSLS
jgi:hypothetical protein